MLPQAQGLVDVAFHVEGAAEIGVREAQGVAVEDQLAKDARLVEHDGRARRAGPEREGRAVPEANGEASLEVAHEPREDGRGVGRCRGALAFARARGIGSLAGGCGAGSVGGHGILLERWRVMQGAGRTAAGTARRPFVGRMARDPSIGVAARVDGGRHHHAAAVAAQVDAGAKAGAVAHVAAGMREVQVPPAAAGARFDRLRKRPGLALDFGEARLAPVRLVHVHDDDARERARDGGDVGASACGAATPPSRRAARGATGIRARRWPGAWTARGRE